MSQLVTAARPGGAADLCWLSGGWSSGRRRPLVAAEPGLAPLEPSITRSFSSACSCEGRAWETNGWRGGSAAVGATCAVVAVRALMRNTGRGAPRRRSCRHAVAAAAAAVATEVAQLQHTVRAWLAEAKLHENLGADIKARFGAVPQQSESVIAEVIARIEIAAQECIAPSALVQPFGSTVNGFSQMSSDLDVTVHIENEELFYYMSYLHWHTQDRRFAESRRRDSEGGFQSGERPKVQPKVEQVGARDAQASAVQQLASFLPEQGFRVVRSFPHARRPLITLQDRTGECTECDVTIGNRLPLFNSELLKSYSKVDDRLRPLVLLVKDWAKLRGVCGANEGNLSSYAWTIVTIYFAQLADGVPSLQALAKEKRSVVDNDYWGLEREFEASFLTAEDFLASEHAVRRESGLSLAELTYGFFRFFSREYRWGKEVASIRLPERWEADAWFRLCGKNHPEPGIHIEDPIEKRDLNIVLRRDRLAQLKVEFQRAISKLESGCSLDELLSGGGVKG